MTLSFKTITDKSTIKDLTEQVNNIGTELTKSRNIFDITTEVQNAVNSSQKVKLTQDTGVAKNIGTSNYIRDLNEPGYYFLSAQVFSRMLDKPSIAGTPIIINVVSGDTKDRSIQYLYTMSFNDSEIKTLFRYVNGNTSSQWIYLPGLPNGKNRILNAINVENIEEPGDFYITGGKGLPNNFTEGFLHITIDGNDNRQIKFTSIDTGIQYHKEKRTNQAYGNWKKEFEPFDMQQYLISKIKEDTTGSLNLLIYTSDGLSFPDAMNKHMEETGQNNFTFYVQGGVKDSPSDKSLRGMFISEKASLNQDVPLYGVYWGISNDGRIVTGAVNNRSWGISNQAPDTKLLWSGAHNFTDTTKVEKMNDNIANYAYVKIYTRVQGNESPTGTNITTVYNKAHDFFRDKNTNFLCTGSITGMKATYVDFYRVGVLFNNDTFTVTHSNVSNSKAQYVTRIVGYNIFE